MEPKEKLTTTAVPSVKAVCVNTIDPRSQRCCEELHLDEEYTPDYFVIGRSCSHLLVRE